jgi:uncharacterized protein (TIGR02246 family)
MKFNCRFVLIVGAAMLLSCAEPAIDYEAEKEAVMQASRDWSATVAAGNYEEALDVWADDAIMMPPDFPTLDGKEAIREYVMGAANIPGFRISWEPQQAFISKSGDLAYLIEHNVIEIDGKDGQKIVTHGKVVTIWRRGADGQWQNVVDMWNTSPARN